MQWWSILWFQHWQKLISGFRAFTGTPGNSFNKGPKLRYYKHCGSAQLYQTTAPADRRTISLHLFLTSKYKVFSFISFAPLQTFCLSSFSLCLWTRWRRQVKLPPTLYASYTWLRFLGGLGACYKKTGLSLLLLEPESFVTASAPLDVCHSVRSLKGSMFGGWRRDVCVDISLFGGAKTSSTHRSRLSLWLQTEMLERIGSFFCTLSKTHTGYV